LELSCDEDDPVSLEVFSEGWKLYIDGDYSGAPIRLSLYLDEQKEELLDEQTILAVFDGEDG
jgi:hypothetical protein